LIYIAIGAPRVLAETIELKDGKKIIAEVLQKTEEAVVLSKDGGKFIYSIARDNIKIIRESTPEEIKNEEDLKKELVGPPAKKISTDVSRLTKEEKPSTKKDDYRQERYAAQVLAAKKARGRVKIKFSKDRFGVVDALINGKTEAALLVDTGASLVVISRAVATKLGIAEDEGAAKLRVVLADGSETTATPVTLDSVEVGHSKVKGVKAAISETPPGEGLDGLLGMTFLSSFHVKLDSKENCLLLEKY